MIDRLQPPCEITSPLRGYLMKSMIPKEHIQAMVCHNTFSILRALLDKRKLCTFRRRNLQQLVLTLQ